MNGSKTSVKQYVKKDWLETKVNIVSTYRLQFHKGFTFRNATEIIPYLHALGITHIYASPYLKAVAGSTHGYDVIDHQVFNPEIGTVEDYRAFVDALKYHEMSHILDTVPNHMGVDTNDNRWWNDVLANGTSSPYANYFDIDFDGITHRKELKNKVLLPVLGKHYSEALGSGELELKKLNGKSFVTYFNRDFPIHPDTDLQADLNDILARQNYRLSSWKVAGDEINYRRFFDITGLAGLKMEREEVFNDAHNFTFSLIADGSVAGLRVDHPDGLSDPKQYFERLQAKFAAVAPDRVKAGEALFVSVEKILNGDETLREDWSVSGTSGYDFLYAANDLYVDSANESLATQFYREFTNDNCTYADWVYINKCAVLDKAMFSEMSALSILLDALAQADIKSRDFTRRQLHDALREVIACFSVYRSYISSRGVSESDIALVEEAVTRASVRNPHIDSAVLKFIQDSVLLRFPVAQAVLPDQIDFAKRFQQLTSPVNAKGIEDSTFYIFNRLISLNEVGGDPGRFGREPDLIHHYFRHRRERWPLSISTLSTHDTKRSEDVRARLNVLSEIPSEWSKQVLRWKELNTRLCGSVDPNDQYLLYQTLLGAWPLEPMDASARGIFLERIEAYMLKATREAKLRTSWVMPNKEYENSISCLIEKLIDPENKAFLSEFLPFQKKVAYLGMLSSISQTVLKLTAPGISDTYQGTELWDLSLVDPDNRRPVDYQKRKAMLGGLPNPGSAIDVDSLMHRITDGGIKLWTHRICLHHRRQMPELFLKGSYEPIEPTGSQSRHVFSFFRRLDEQILIVLIPRLVASLLSGKQWRDASWENTSIQLPTDLKARRFQNILTGEKISFDEDGALPVSAALSRFPAAVFVNET